MPGSHQHRLLLQSNARFSMFENALDDVLRLKALVLDADQPRSLCRRTIGKEIFSESLRRERDHRVGRLEDWLSGAVVLLESYAVSRRRELRREVENVAHRRAPT